MLEATSEKKFLLLKKRLDALHYCQPLTIDSAPLVEKLLNDFIKTTEGFQNLKKVNEELQQAAFRSESAIEPLKKENNRILKENNDLHYEIIKVKEDAEFKENRWQNTIKSLEGDKIDLRFVIQQKDATIKRLEDENVAVRHKLDLVLKKSYLTSGNGFENLPPQIVSLKEDTSKFNLSKPLRPQDGGDLAEELKKTSAEEYQKWAESLRRADDKANKYKEDIKALNDLKATLEQKIKHLEIQVNNRDKEVERLQSKLDVSGNSLEKISLDYQAKTAQEQVARLNSQIDFLSRDNQKMDEELKKARKELSRTDHLRTEISNLNSTINDLHKKNDEANKLLKDREGALDRIRTFKQTEQENLTETKKKIDIEYKREITELKDRIEKLSQENKALKDTKSQATQSIAAYQSDKNIFKETVETLTVQNSELTKQVDELNSLLARKDNEVAILRDRQTQLEGQIQFLNREVDQLRNTQDRLSETQKDDTEAITKLRDKILELEDANLRLQNQRNDLQIELEAANRLRSNYEEQLEKTRVEVTKTKSDAETGTQTQQRLQTMYQNALKDIEFLKRERDALETRGGESKKTITELEIKSNEYFENLQIAHDKNKNLERELATLRDQLSERHSELLNNKLKNTEIEREFADLKISNDKLAHQIEKNRRLKEDLLNLEDQVSKLKKQIEEYQLEIKDQKALNEKLQELNEKERNEKIRLSDQINQLINETENIDINLKRARDRENEYNRIIEALDESKRNEKNLIAEVERLKADVKKQEYLISNGTKQVDHLNRQKDELLNDIKNLRDEIGLLKMNDSEIKTKSIKLQEKINNYDILIADLKEDKAKADGQVTRLEEEINNKKREIQSEKAANQELSERVKQLKTLCEGLEKTKDELLIRVQNKGQERRVEEEEKNRLQDRINQLQRRLEDADNQVAEARRSLVDLDRDRDTLQAQLDEKTEQLAKTKSRCDTLEDEARLSKEKASEFFALNDKQISRVQELEGQLREYAKKNKNLHEENAQLTNILNLKEADLQRLSNDLNQMSREHQAFNNQMMSVLEEKEQIREALQGINNQEKMTRQTLRAAELEKDDLLNNYRTACVDNERLKRQLDEVSNDNQELFKKIKEYEREYAFLKNQLSQAETKEGQLMNEIQAYERNVTVLNKRLEQADIAIKENQLAKERLMRDFQEVKQVREGIEYSKEDLQRNLMQAEKERIYLQEQIRDLKRELENTAAFLEHEKRKAQQLEDILSEERKNQYTQNLNLQTLESEKVELQFAMQNAERRIHELQQRVLGSDSTDSQNRETSQSHQNIFADMQRTINSLEKKLNEKENELSSLVYDQKSLRDENSKLRLSLFKAETERNEIDRQSKLKESLGAGSSRSSYARELEESPKVGGEGWGRLKLESETYKKQLDDASLSSQYLKDKVRSLQREYGEGLPERKYKP